MGLEGIAGELTEREVHELIPEILPDAQAGDGIVQKMLEGNRQPQDGSKTEKVGFGEHWTVLEDFHSQQSALHREVR